MVHIGISHLLTIIMSITLEEQELSFYDAIEEIIPHPNHLNPPPDSLMNTEFTSDFYVSPTLRMIVYLIHVREVIDLELEENY